MTLAVVMLACSGSSERIAPDDTDVDVVPTGDSAAPIAPETLGSFAPELGWFAGPSTAQLGGWRIAFTWPTPLAADRDGDGIDELGIHDPRSGDLHWLGGEVEPLGMAADTIAVAGDWDGDGVDTIELLSTLEGTPLAARDGDRDVVVTFRDGVFTFPDRQERVEGEGLPYAGDLDGDGVAEVGLYVGSANHVRVPVVARWPELPDPPTGTGLPAGPALPLNTAVAALPANTRALLVAQGGHSVHETFLDGMAAQNIKSVSKSLLAAVLLQAQHDGVVPETAPATLLQAGSKEHALIGWDALLSMQAGMDWQEDAIAAWFATDDWTANALSPVTATPGSVFRYSTANTHLASAAISTVRPTDQLARELLFDPAGIEVVRWDRAPDGVPVGGADVLLHPRDLLRLGQLFLDDGRLDGQSILAPGVVADLLAERVAPAAIDGDLGYAAWWWTRSFGALDATFAWGHGGQLVVLLPEADAVVVVVSRSDVDHATSTAVSYALFDVIEQHIVPTLTE